MAKRKPPHPGIPNSMVKRPPIRPATRPMGRPRFRLIPHWIPGTIASTMIAFIPIRTMVLLRSVERDKSYHKVIKQSKIKNTPMITLGIPSLSISQLLNNNSTVSTRSAKPK